MRESVRFVGGPWDGETREIEWSPRLQVEGGCYTTIPTFDGGSHRMAWNGALAEREIQKLFAMDEDETFPPHPED